MCVLFLQAQNLAVQSFRLDEADLTANTTGTIVMDQNGQKCALIKVETTQQGFSFDTGSLGVVKTEQKVGEIWVYVPEGVKRLTISHQQLGILRDYDLGQTLKRAKTYILTLTSGEVQTIVKQARTSQYVVFQLQPENAVVMLDNEMLQTTSGTATKMMKFGTYDYRVQAPDYLPEVGKVTVNDPKNKHVVNVSLKPNFSKVTLTVDGNAEIWANGEQKGTGQWTGNLGAGTYEFETRKAAHRPATTTRDIAAASQPLTIQLNAPTPIYGEVDINSTPAMADIYIDGTKVGQTPQVVSQLLIGEHQVRLSRQGYTDYSGSITVREGETTPFSATLKDIAQRPIKQSTTPNNSIAIKTSENLLELDSFSYLFGIANSNGLKKYLFQRMDVDTLQINDFARGFDNSPIAEENALISSESSRAEAQMKAFLAGKEIRKQLDEQVYPNAAKQVNDSADVLNKEFFVQGFRDGFTGANSISMDSVQVLVKKQMEYYHKIAMEKKYGANRIAGEEFLKANAKKKDVKMTPSGLQYRVLTKGTGKLPTREDKVKVNYEGHLIDGTEFDNSYTRGKAVTFPVDQVIAGWTEALCMMPVGSKWVLYVPQELAYKDREQAKIPPFSCLIFTVELLEIENEK